MTVHLCRQGNDCSRFARSEGWGLLGAADDENVSRRIGVGAWLSDIGFEHDGDGIGSYQSYAKAGHLKNRHDVHRRRVRAEPEPRGQHLAAGCQFVQLD